MRKMMKKATAYLLTLALLIALVPAAPVSAATVSDLGSLLDAYAENGEGTYTLTAESRLFVALGAAPTGELLQTAQLIQRQMRAKYCTGMELVWGPESYAKTGDIVLKLDTTAGIGAEGYKLTVGDTAVVTAADVDGLLYGANMLMKCFNNSTTLSGFTASDAPDTRERTVMLDCGRKYLTAEWIKNFIRQMSWMGYNTIELHFSEDGGFRADFWDPNYYTDSFRPDNDFTWLCGSHVQSWVYDGNANDESYPYSDDPDAGKYLTTAELVEICEVAKEYHIDVVPSFDSPAHMDYITWKFEQNYKSNTSYSFTYGGTTYKASSTSGCINYKGVTGRTTPTWPHYTTIDITDGTMAKAFVFALYEDIADFFKEYAGSTDFSIGADEVAFPTGYAGTYTWNYSKFPGYVNDLNALLNGKGYTMRMFNDFIGTTAYSTTQSFDSNIEIMYWDSPFQPTTGGSGASTEPASYFVNEGRTIYNCIQTHTYHVLRIANSSSAATKYTDARNPANRQWTFYHSTEDLIYDEWVPNNVSEKGKYSESVADIPTNQLGGAYFLIWNDYASVSTEDELWNGAPDTTGTNNGVTYYLLDRMASNIIKQWNWDINSTVDFEDFAAVRDTFGNFPGFTKCSELADLPAATAPTQAYLADHSALTAALADVIAEQGSYTDESWAAYQAAVAAAEEVNADHGATAGELEDALSALKNAEAALEEKSTETEPTDPTEPPENNFTVTYKTTTSDGTVKEVKKQGYYLSETAVSFQIYLPPMVGYSFDRAENCTFVPLASGDGSGYLRGTNNGGSVVVWLTNEPDTSRLEALAEEGLTAQGSYTADSWSAYQTALENAKRFTVGGSTTQADIDNVVNALLNAHTALVQEGETEIIEIEVLVGKDGERYAARLGKQVGLRITTSADVSGITVDGETLTVHTGRVQELDGKTVKVWLVCFPADQAGTFQYTIHAGSVSQQIAITVK